MIKSVHIDVFGKEFDLDVVYDLYAESSCLPALEKALQIFVSHPEWIKTAKSKVLNYCGSDVLSDEENSTKNDLFSYLTPHRIYLKRDAKRVAIMCKYLYDLEHGLAVVFDSEGNVTVGIQDIII